MVFIFLILLSTFLVVLINICCNAFGYSWWMLLVFSVLSTIFVIIIDGITALIIRHLPEKWFRYEKKIFNVSKKEVAFYRFLNIKAWKDKVPELGGFTSFHKDKIQDPTSVQYIERFLLEIDYGWVIHIISVFTGFLILLMDYKIFIGGNMSVGLSIGIPIAVINAILNLLPAFILRYNYPRLRALLKMAKRKK